MNPASLSDEQWALLNQYRFQKWDPSDADGTGASLLLEDGEMVRYLEDRFSLMGADDLKTAGSLFMKRYAFVAALGMLAMTFWNKKLNVSPDNLLLVDHVNDKGLWLPQICLKDTSVQEFTSWSEKEEFIRSLFSEHLDPFIGVMKRSVKLSNLILWENIAVYLFWIYENDELITDENILVKKERDFARLLSDENSHWFGAYNKNPLNRYYTEKVRVEGLDDKIRVRKTCCFSYRLENGEQFRCKSCPQTCKVKRMVF
ncbi:IucA/IucC family C-terminal-domain containing protein [Rossellomorea oryzaecorticis]|uniref:IucA/IucC family C-terminal-domain containing protein n=1 Tax=Rossellomorea oryzaecorticis TaxID=1396505 RepID=A0ABU9K8T8_9BACI